VTSSAGTVSAVTALGSRAPKTEPPAEAPEPRSKKKRIIIVAVVVAVMAAGAWHFLAPSGPTGPVPGEIVTLEPTQINLAGGHYLKVGVALQLVEGAAAADIDGSKALDATIDVFTGLSMTEVSQSRQRHELKKKLGTELADLYDGDVMGVYFTEYVTQ